MKSRKRFDQINVIPYVDVLLVLLLVFMVTAPMMHHHLPIDLPKAKLTKSTDSKTPVWYMTIDAKGRYYLGKKSVSEEPMTAEQLVGRIRFLKRGLSQLPIVQVQAEKTISYQILITALTAFQDQGIEKINFVYRS